MVLAHVAMSQSKWLTGRGDNSMEAVVEFVSIYTNVSNIKLQMAVALGERCIEPWREVAAVCHDAAVFLDDGAGELLHWAGGVALLDGSIGVYDLFGELNLIARDFISKVCAK